MDLSRLSTQDLLALKAGDLSRVSTEGLRMLKGEAPKSTERQAGEMALEGMSGLDKFRAGMGKALTDIVRGTGQTLGVVDQRDVTESKQRDAALMNSGAGMAGNVVGNIAAAAPAAFIPGANTVVGAAAIGGGMGALQPVAEGESRATNIGLGAAGGALGQTVGQAAGRFLRPVQSNLSPQQTALANAARARGIPLDAADITGSRPLTVMRDVMANLPLTADRQATTQAAKQAAFNRAVAGTFGSSDDALTPAALQGARDRLGQQFTALSNRNTMQASPQFLNDLAAIEQAANRSMTPDVARVVRNHIDDVLARVEPGDVMNGNAYRALDSELGRVLRTSSNGDIRHGVGQVRDALRTAMDQSISAADRQAWQQARREYANLMTVAPLAARSETGDVSGRALLAAANRGGRSTAFTGAGDLGELGRIGRAFIAEQTPNSGTAQRSFYQRLLTENPLIAAWHQGVGGISYPVQALLNSPAGQQYFSQGLVQLTPRQQAMINAVLRTSGAAALPSVQTMQ